MIVLVCGCQQPRNDVTTLLDMYDQQAMLYTMLDDMDIENAKLQKKNEYSNRVIFRLKRVIKNQQSELENYRK